MFDEFSARNQQRNSAENSEFGIRNSELNVDITSGNANKNTRDNSADNTLLRTKNAENPQKEPLTNINQGNMQVSDRRYAIEEIYVQQLKKDDIDRYYKTGKTGHVIHKKENVRALTGSAVLATSTEIENFVKDSIEKSSNITKGYAVVPRALSDKIADASDNHIIAENWFLELSSDDIHHLYQEHHKAKNVGDLDMEADDVVTLVQKVDGEADVLGIERYRTQTKVKLGIQTDTGDHYIVAELVSSGSQALRLKTAWRISEEKYYKIKKEEEMSAHNRTNKSPAISDKQILFDNSIPEKTENVKGVYENSLDKQFALPIDEENMQVSDRQYAVYSNKILNTIKKAIQAKGKLDTEYNQVQISKVTPKIAQMVKAASGGLIDISSKYVALNGSDLWHEYKRHSDSVDETGRRQITITPETMQEAIMAIYDPDIVESIYTTKDNPAQRQSFAYAKQSANGHYVVVEAVGGRKNPNITPVMVLEFNSNKWNSIINSGLTLGEILYEADEEMKNALDVEYNKKNRVTAAQFASNKAIANTPRSPQFDNSIPQTTQKSNGSNKISSKNSSERQFALDIESENVRLRAEWEGDRVFSEEEIEERLYKKIKHFKYLKKSVKNEIIHDLWVGLNESRNAEERKTAEIMATNKIVEAITLNPGSEFGLTEASDRKQLTDKVIKVVSGIAKSYKLSERAKLEKIFAQQAKTKANAEKREAIAKRDSEDFKRRVRLNSPEIVKIRYLI